MGRSSIVKIIACWLFQYWHPVMSSSRITSGHAFRFGRVPQTYIHVTNGVEKSAAISAAAHRPVEDEDARLLPVKLGSCTSSRSG